MRIVIVVLAGMINPCVRVCTSKHKQTCNARANPSTIYPLKALGKRLAHDHNSNVIVNDKIKDNVDFTN